MRTLDLSITVSVAICLATPAFGQTGPSLDALLEKVEDVYNTDKLRDARTIRLMEDRRMPFASHDYGTDFHDVTRQRRFTVVDPKGQRGTKEYQTAIQNNFWHGRSIDKDGKRLFIDYFSGQYEDQGEYDFYTEYGTTVRNYDVMMALNLIENSEDASIEDNVIWLGTPHTIVRLKDARSVDQLLYIDSESGFITRMDRIASPEITIHYSYDNHHIQDGITIAGENTVFRNEEPLFFNMNRQIEINARADKRAFEIDRGIVLEPTRLDQSEMTVEPIGNMGAVVHVGVEEQYSTFFKTDQGLLIFGSYSGLGNRIQAYRDETGDSSPIRFVVVPDHHDADVAGVADAVAAGATILTTVDARDRVINAAGSEMSPDQVQTVSDEFVFGNVNVISSPTSHASQVLFAYNTENRVFAQSEHYYMPYEEEEYYVRETGVDMLAVIEAKGLDINFITASHNRKVEGWSDFLKAVEKYNPTPCMNNRPLCRGL